MLVAIKKVLNYEKSIFDNRSTHILVVVVRQKDESNGKTRYWKKKKRED